MGGFRKEFGDIAKLIDSVLIVQVVSMVIGVAALCLMYCLIYLRAFDGVVNSPPGNGVDNPA